MKKKLIEQVPQKVEISVTTSENVEEYFHPNKKPIRKQEIWQEKKKEYKGRVDVFLWLD